MLKTFSGGGRSLKADAARYGTAIVLLLCAGVLLLISGIRQYPAMLGMAVISFTFGLRHAFDVDHIAAIDNMSRKMIHTGKDPRGAGFFFSLGHSTVVIIMSAVVIFGVKWAVDNVPAFSAVGGVVGTLISGVFLLLLALLNLWIVRDIWVNFRHMRRGTYTEESLEASKNRWLNRQIQRLMRIVDHNWQVMVVGFLFGLGFDTATQIAMLATAATASNQGVPWYAVLSFPLFFTAGMCMMDTADGFFVSSAYQWVFTSPLKKVYYNLTITSISILAAGVIGLIEILQLIGMQTGAISGFFSWIQNIDLNFMGFILVGIFIVVWAVSLAFWKIFRMSRWEQCNEPVVK